MRFIFFCWMACGLGTMSWAADLPDAVMFSVTIEAGDQPTAKRWLAAGLPPDFDGRSIGTGIMIGAWEGNLSMMEIFLKAGGDVNFVNAFGEQAILHAAWKGRLDAVRWLLEHGARMDRDGKAWSALHYATFAGQGEIVTFLLERGANVNALSTNGSTSLMMAAREGHQGIAEKLMAAGAKTDIINDHGESAVQWAVRNNNTKIAKMIGGAALSSPAVAIQTGMSRQDLAVPRSRPIPDAVNNLLAQARQTEGLGQGDEASIRYQAAMKALHDAGTNSTERLSP